MRYQLLKLCFNYDYNGADNEHNKADQSEGGKKTGGKWEVGGGGFSGKPRSDERQVPLLKNNKNVAQFDFFRKEGMCLADEIHGRSVTRQTELSPGEFSTGRSRKGTR